VLIRDLTVRVHDGTLAERLEIYAEGTERFESGVRFGRQLYRAGAFLPRGAPRAALRAEVSAVAANAAPAGRNGTIGVVAIAEELCAALRAARRGEGRIDPDQLGSQPFAALHTAVSPHWRSSGVLLPLGYGHNPPGFRTVTYDAAAERFIGLHIDDLDALPLAERAGSTNRLCVNLGRCARYLLFVNLSCARMAELLARHRAGPDYSAWRSTPLIHAFLATFPGYPVLRLAVRPGEAYVAPTENMIHDGATDGMTADDEQVTVRGCFDPV
jgi:hypothetical protein